MFIAATATGQLIYQYSNRYDNGIRKNLDWLEIYETREHFPLFIKSMKRKIRPKLMDKEDDLNDYILFSKRVNWTHWIMFYLFISSSTVYGILFTYTTYISVPHSYHFPFAFLNCMHIWLIQVFCSNYFFFPMGLFHQVCYHLLLRFKSINRKLTDLSKKMSLKQNLKNFRILESLLCRSSIPLLIASRFLALY